MAAKPFQKKGEVEMEHFFTCPYCWERISMILDPQEESSDYIEDCEVCCRPIEIYFTFSDERLVAFEAQRMEGI
jgi:transcription elongation factor Elf1